ncbi:MULTISPECIES: hypothetical protein [Acidiferrobacter]
MPKSLVRPSRRTPPVSLLAPLLASFWTPAHWTLVGATAVKYAAAQKAVFIRRRQGPIGAFVGGFPKSMVAGLDYNDRIGPVLLGLGGAYLTHTTFVNGTHWNFEVRLAYRFTPRLEALWTHFSNCKQICGFDRSGPNLGWEFLGIGYRFS